MNFVIIGDLNDLENYHVGDEAMLEANLGRLRELFPDASFTVISQSPEFTARHYIVNSLPYFGFSQKAGDTDERQTLLKEILGLAENYKESPPINDEPDNRTKIFASLKCCDALIVSGGGNLNSHWPHHIYERVALIKIAALYGKPALVTGQTLGPYLTSEDQTLLIETLPLAQLVGFREKVSIEVGRKLALPQNKIVYQLDDASFLAPTPPGPGANSGLIEKLASGQTPWIAITMHHFTDLETARGQAQLKALAGQIIKIAAQTNAQPVFLPHVAASAGSNFVADEVVGRELARLFKPDLEMPVLEVRPAGEMRWLTGQAALVISTRYHPLVFGLAAGVPALGIYVDQYTHIKLEGVLEHAGLSEWLMPVGIAQTELFSRMALELWQVRQEISKHLESVRNRWQEEYQNHWQRIYGVITTAQDKLKSPKMLSLTEETTLDENVSFNSSPLVQNPGPGPSRFLAGLITNLEKWQTADTTHLEEVRAETTRYITSLLQEISALRQMQGDKEDYIHSLKETLAQKDAYIKSLVETLGQKDVYGSSVKDALAQKDTYITSLKETLAQKDTYIKSLSETVDEYRSKSAKQNADSYFFRRQQKSS